MYPSKSYSAQMNAVPQFSPTPAYGGDCALQAPEGLSSATDRLQDIARQLNDASWQLRTFFGMNSQEPCCEGKAIESGYKVNIDGAVALCRSSLENVNLILLHLQS